MTAYGWACLISALVLPLVLAGLLALNLRLYPKGNRELRTHEDEFGDYKPGMFWREP